MRPLLSALVLLTSAAALAEGPNVGVVVSEQKTPDGSVKIVQTPPGQTPKVTVRVEQKGWDAYAKNLQALKERAEKAEAQLAQVQEQSLQKVVTVKHDERGTVLSLTGYVLFKFNSDELLPQAEQRLGEVAKVLKQQKDGNFKVEGYTDSIGSDEYNQQLSERRAESVKKFLVSQGVPDEVLQAEGKGESSPVASNDNPEGRANNRRVEIILPNESGIGIGGSGKDMKTPDKSDRDPTERK